MDPSPTRHRGAFLMTESSHQDHDGGSARQVTLPPASTTTRRRFKVGRVRFRQIGSSCKDHGLRSVRQTSPDFAASATTVTTLRPLGGLALPTATPPLGGLAPPTATPPLGGLVPPTATPPVGVLVPPSVSSDLAGFDLSTRILLDTQSEDEATSVATGLIFTEFNFADLKSDSDKTDGDDDEYECSIKARFCNGA